MAVRPYDPGEMHTVKGAAAYLQVSDKTIRRLIDRREIAFVAVGGQIRISEHALLDYIRRKTTEAREEAWTEPELLKIQ